MDQQDQPVSRRQFLNRASKATGGVLALGAIPQLLAACSPGSETTANLNGNSTAAPTASPQVTSPASLQPVTMAIGNLVMNPAISYYWVGMNDKLGWYEEEGIQGAWEGVDGQALNLQLVEQGQFQSGLGVQDALLTAGEAGNAPDIRLFYCSTYELLFDIAVPPDSAITEVAELRGRNISITGVGAGAHYFAQVLLRSAGVDPDTEVEFVPTGAGPAQLEALNRGSIDAIASFDTDFAALIGIHGADLRFLPVPDDIAAVRAGNSFGSQAAWVDANPELVVGIGRVMSKSAIFTEENPAATLRLHFELFPETLPSGKSVDEAVEELVPGMSARVEKVMPPPGHQLGEFIPEAWDGYVDYLGVDVDPSEFYTNEFVEDFNDFDHDAVRRLAQEL